MTIIVILLVLLVFVLIAVSVGLTIFCFFIPYGKRTPADRVTDMHVPEPVRKKMEETYRLMDEVPSERIEITSYDGYKLVGRYYEMAGPGAPIVIGVHGYHGVYKFDGIGSFHYARDYGKNILLIDQRAHGESGSRYTCFGLKERFDCKQWAEYVVSRFGQNQEIILLGVSMGAATVTMAMELGLPNQVKCVIADCGYTSPEAIIKNTGKNMGLSPQITYPLIYVGARLLAGIKLNVASSIDVVKKIDIPILFIHGEIDDFVPTDMGRELYAACVSSHKKLYITPNAKHAMSGIIDTKQYGRVIDEFVTSL